MTAPVSDPLSRSETVRVDLGARSYDIAIGEGLIGEAGRRIAQACGPVRAAVVADETVAGHYLEPLAASLAAASIPHVAITLPPGEATKRMEMLEHVVDRILEARLERGDVVVALGGGVIGDLAGFAAAIVRRGMGFVQIPTSLLAQVDSSVGGKTGINSRHGKNLIGAFHQPKLVLADTDALQSLTDRHFRAGYAEVAKYGLIDDSGFFEWLEENWRHVFQGGAARVEAIARSCAAKARVVAADERESGSRALLNLGHTFGHALEAATGFGERLIHGEAVAVGTAMAHRFSVRLGLCDEADCDRAIRHLDAVGLPTRLAQIERLDADAGSLLALIGQDKKVKRGKLTFILTRGLGRSFIADDVDPEKVEDFLQQELTD